MVALVTTTLARVTLVGATLVGVILVEVKVLHQLLVVHLHLHPQAQPRPRPQVRPVTPYGEGTLTEITPTLTTLQVIGYVVSATARLNQVVDLVIL